MHDHQNTRDHNKRLICLQTNKVQGPTHTFRVLGRSKQNRHRVCCKCAIHPTDDNELRINRTASGLAHFSFMQIPPTHLQIIHICAVRAVYKKRVAVSGYPLVVSRAGHDKGVQLCAVGPGVCLEYTTILSTLKAHHVHLEAHGPCIVGCYCAVRVVH